MKHNLKITLLLLAMFVVTQCIGLFVVYQYFPHEIVVNGVAQTSNATLPYGMAPPETPPEISLISIIFSFAIALALLLLLSKFRAVWLMKGWFFLVVVLSLSVAINALFIASTHYTQKMIPSASVLAFVIAVPFAYWKMFRRNFLIHNATELFIYPGIASIFVPILNIPTIIILLVLISLYDIYAVWHAGFMQKMAKYQIQHLKVFSGFFVPYASKKQKAQIKLVQQTKSDAKRKQLGKKIKVHVALLGGGDVVFPIITSGVVFAAWGFIPALLVILGATLGLAYLLFFAEKGKFYPAMPYITAGIFSAMAAGYFVHILA